MTAYKCDRCGILYEPYDGVKPSTKIMASNGVRFTRDSALGQTQTTVQVLCPECMNELAEWWNRKEK
ncbi:MAG: hypothetical protein LUD72_02920 [Bacteroidales bacterium]|nr:hypothetical protein [Bacteroidales bacterium]